VPVQVKDPAAITPLSGYKLRHQLKAASGGYEILSANMPNGCLDVVGASTASGAHIEQNICTGSANQIFNVH
jgi:Ricin-type beta-trefoil lectin domain-like